MNSPEADVVQQPSTPAGPMIRTLMGIAMLSGFLVVLTYQLTKPIIAENQRRAIEAAVFQVIPGAVERRDFVVNEEGVSAVSPEQPVEGKTIYAGYDADGQLLTGSFMDYAMPRADDMPSFEFATHEVPCANNAMGVKGCGEAGSLASPPAVINAMVDALSDRGITHIDMPATPQKVWQLLHKQ